MEYSKFAMNPSDVELFALTANALDQVRNVLSDVENKPLKAVVFGVVDVDGKIIMVNGGPIDLLMMALDTIEHVALEALQGDDL